MMWNNLFLVHFRSLKPFQTSLLSLFLSVLSCIGLFLGSNSSSICYTVKKNPSGHVGAWPHSFGTKMSSKFSFGTLIVYPKAFHLHLKWLKYSTKSRRYSHLRVSGSIFINAWLTLTGVKVLPQKHRSIEQISMYWAQITFVRWVSCWEMRTDSKNSTN